MTELQWKAFKEFREEYKALCEKWMQLAPELKVLQEKAAYKEAKKNDSLISDPPYPVETPVVYNTAYDEITEDDEINLIVIGDNPGKEEQMAAKRKYLVGQSGRIAEGFFRRNSELGTDFRKNAIIINKTPVHSAKTNQLKDIIKEGSSDVKDLIYNSQKDMARLASKLHTDLVKYCDKNKKVPELWLVGYSELKEKKIFGEYRDCLKNEYLRTLGSEGKESWNKVFVYQHFSMNRFSIDLKAYMQNNERLDLTTALKNLGQQHKNEIFGDLD